MRSNLTKTFAVFGVFIILAMFINIVSFIEGQNSQSITSPIISAFDGWLLKFKKIKRTWLQQVLFLYLLTLIAK